jgi:fructosamine-3-kinase
MIHDVLQGFGEVVDVRPIGGGCISDAQHVRVRTADGSNRSLFVKSNVRSFLDNFQCEAAGLNQLHDTGTIRVPQVFTVTEAGQHAYLVAEWIDEGQRGADYFADFGRQLAALHRAACGDEYGWQRDNYLGAAKQINSVSKDWPAFVAEHRIGFQLRWAVDQQRATENLSSACEQIIQQMPQLLEGRDDRAALLHGDLWSGNYLCDSGGQPVIIDPAVYQGCREAEFGMLQLFGSCPPAFYQAYQDALPMPAGWQRRVSVYVLYHLLNHLNLFGTGYLGQCQSLAAKILRS